jgi:hypothetical protein
MILPQVHLGESGLEAMINTVALEKRIAPSSISSSLLWALGLFEEGRPPTGTPRGGARLYLRPKGTAFRLAHPHLVCELHA